MRNSLHKQNFSFFFLKDVPLPWEKHMLLGPCLTGSIMVRAQREPLGGQTTLSIIKWDMFPWVYEKQKEGCTSFT